MSAGDDGRFDVAPVAVRRRVVGPLVVVVVALAVVGAGLWKPWAAPEAARFAALPATSQVAPGPTGSAPGADPATGDRPAFFGLDLASMGDRVERSSWGVAAAYVPLDEIVRAESIDRSWVTPVVSWQSVVPDNNVRGPSLDRDETATVALAATWPAESEPRSVELEYIGPASRGVARATPGLPRMVPLSAGLPTLMSTIPAEWIAIEGPAVRGALPAVRGAPVETRRLADRRLAARRVRVLARVR